MTIFVAVLSQAITAKMVIMEIIAQTKYNPKLGPFPLYFGPENGHSRGSTSNGSSEQIFMFLESVEQREWE